MHPTSSAPPKNTRFKTLRSRQFCKRVPIVSLGEKPMISGHDRRILLRTGAIASIGMLILIPLQIAVFVLYPPPAEALQWFELFSSNRLLALIELDLLYIIDNTLVSLVYLALYVLLKEKSKGVMLIALLLGLLGIAAYYSSNPAFEMMEAHKAWAAAATDAERTQWLTIANMLLLQINGSAFITYYILNGACLILISLVLMNREGYKRIGIIGLISGILMSIPSPFGILGMICALLSLIPWMLFLILLLRPFWKG